VSSGSRTPQTKSRWKTWGAPTLALLGAVAFVSFIAPPLLPYARTHDFISLYTGGVLAKTNPSHLYDVQLQDKIQLELAPERPVLAPFIRPAYSALFYVPLTWMPFETAFVVWIALGTLIAIAIQAWAARRFGSEALVFCAFFLPLIYGIVNGQDTAFVAGLMVLTYSAAKRGAYVLCGVLLALLLCKFHLILLVPVVLLWRREWRILAGFCPTAIALVGISATIASPRSYIAVLTNPALEALNPSPQMMVNTLAIAVNFGLDFAAVKALLALGVLAAVLLIPRNAPLDRWFWTAVCGSLLLSPHTFEYDVALLLIPIMRTLTDSQCATSLRFVAATAAIPLPYFMTLLPMPLSAGPALVITLLFLTIAWPQWFDRRAAATEATTQPAGSPAESWQ